MLVNTIPNQRIFRTLTPLLPLWSRKICILCRCFSEKRKRKICTLQHACGGNMKTLTCESAPKCNYCLKDWKYLQTHISCWRPVFQYSENCKIHTLFFWDELNCFEIYNTWRTKLKRVNFPWPPTNDLIQLFRGEVWAYMYMTYTGWENENQSQKERQSGERNRLRFGKQS